MKYTISKKFIKELVEQAETHCPHLDDDNYDGGYGGGDSGDDVEQGIYEGRIEMARSVLNHLGVDYTIESLDEDEEDDE